MMDRRGQLLHDLDEAAGEVTRRCGRDQGNRDLAALFDLAESIAQAVGEWRDLISGCERQSPCDPRRAAVLILESVFDELLPAPHWRLLAAALALTWPTE
jgi:hypothetical protein